MSGVKQWETGWVCPECGMIRQADGHDPCIGELPGVKFACCGHGGNGAYLGYIHFVNGVTVRFEHLKVD